MSGAWLHRSVLVTVGTGGVGKTTTAAAIGIEAAARGRRTLVLTIDPARRLADALGVDALDHEIRQVPPERVAPDGGGAELYATMLDTQRALDDLVERLAPDVETRERIQANPIYRSLTDALSGSREYSALERLHQLHQSGAYDLIVLDTPPASHALDFLDAPRRLTGFLDGSFLELLTRPVAGLGQAGFRWLRVGSERALDLLQRVTGLGFLRSLSEFLVAFESLLVGIRASARDVEALLRDPRCGFVLVTGPDPEQARQAVAFYGRLRKEEIHLVGLVINRVHTWPGAPDAQDDAPARDAATHWLRRSFDAETTARLVDLAARHLRLARRDAAMCERLEKALPVAQTQRRRIPLLSEDVHTVAGLSRLRAELFAASGEA